jgi:hypothetical protein
MKAFEPGVFFDFKYSVYAQSIYRFSLNHLKYQFELLYSQSSLNELTNHLAVLPALLEPASRVFGLEFISDYFQSMAFWRA